MSEYLLYLATVLLISVSVFALNPAQAASHQIDFHNASRMVHKNYGPVDKAYGLMTLTTDSNGKGAINVMFSNGSRLNSARFNARVKFLNTSGTVIKEEIYNQWLPATEFQDAIEGKVSKPIDLSNFDSIEVEFYLSDFLDQGDATRGDINATGSQTVGYRQN